MTAKRSPKKQPLNTIRDRSTLPKKPNHPGDPEAAAAEMACIVEVGGIPYIERKKKEIKREDEHH